MITDQIRPPTTARDPRWPDLRARTLMLHPWCAACGHRDRSFLEVHHILPFHLFPLLELDPSNLIVLCDDATHPCHRILGHAYDWTDYNPDVITMCSRLYLIVQTRRSLRT